MIRYWITKICIRIAMRTCAYGDTYDQLSLALRFEKDWLDE